MEPGWLLQGLRPEAELMIRCLRPELDAACAERVRQLAGTVDWRVLYRLASSSALPAISARMEELSPEALSAETREILKTHFLSAQQQHELLSRHLLSVRAALQSRGLDTVPFLETTFGYCVSQDARVRPCRWLDFLIQPENSEAARQALLEGGQWEMSIPVVATRDRGREKGAFVVVNRGEECWARFVWGAAPWTRAVDFNVQQAWARSVVCRVRGQAVPVFAPEDLLLLRCIDSSEALWDLIAIADVVSLLRAYPKLNWDFVLAETKRTGTRRLVLLGLSLAAGLLEQQLPEAAARAVADDHTLQKLMRQVCYRMFVPEAKPLKIPEVLRFHLRSREQIRDRARNLWRFVITPTEADVNAVRLPSALAFLYPVVRAGRLGGRLLGLPVEDSLRRITGKPENLSGFSPTRMAVVDQMLELGEVGPQDVVYDLGCGDGRIVVRAAQQFGARGVGIDIDPERIREARARAREAGVEDRVEFHLADARAVDLGPATVVMLYLPQRANLLLLPKLERELRPGTRIISQDADLGRWDQIVGYPYPGSPTVLFRRKIRREEPAGAD